MHAICFIHTLHYDSITLITISYIRPNLVGLKMQNQGMSAAK